MRRLESSLSQVVIPVQDQRGATHHRVFPSETASTRAHAGTDSEELLSSPFYVGARHPRVRGEAYDELLAELLEAVKLRFGNSTLIHMQVLFRWPCAANLCIQS